MKLEHRTDIQSYYDLASVSNNDINFVAFLLYLLRYKPTVKIITDLEKLKVSQYENDFNFLLDELKTGTIKNLYSIYEITQGAITDGNE